MNAYVRVVQFAALVHLLIPKSDFGQGISGVVVTAPQLIFVSGQQLQLEAIARDGQGNPRTGDRFTYRTSNPTVVSVDATGMATAGNPGVASISVAVQGTNSTSPTIQIQVIPLRIDITGGNTIVQVGDSTQ